VWIASKTPGTLTDLGVPNTHHIRRAGEHPAVNLTELRGKAAVLATLLRSVGEGGSGPIMQDHFSKALALSITDDIAGLP
jgi:hypothetical protein